jgi:dihydropteroate synthase
MTSTRRPGGSDVDPGVVIARPERGGAEATPSFRLPAGAGSGLPGRPAPSAIGRRTFDWGSRTFVMGIVNVTPDSFSGDGLLGTGDPVAAAVELARTMADDGADVVDVGGESSRPGHARVDDREELARVVPVVAAVRQALPELPISVDTIKPVVAAAALDAGADLINDVSAVTAADDGLFRLVAERRVPIVLMHDRAEARYVNLLAEILADLERAIERALAAGVAWDAIVVDPGFGFGKTPEHNLALLRELAALRVLGRPVLLGASRKSTLGRVLDLPPEERLEATIATTVLAATAGLDLVRVHDVRPNVRAARTVDAVVRG